VEAEYVRDQRALENRILDLQAEVAKYKSLAAMWQGLAKEIGKENARGEASDADEYVPPSAEAQGTSSPSPCSPGSVR
jgi:hypothetical protein